MTDTLEIDRDLLEQTAHLLTRDGVHSPTTESVVNNIESVLDEQTDNSSSNNSESFYNDELGEVYDDLTNRRDRIEDVCNIIKHVEDDITAIDCDRGAASVSQDGHRSCIGLNITIHTTERCDEVDNILTMDKMEGVNVYNNDVEYKMDDGMNYFEWDLRVTIDLRGDQ